ncbi:TPA: ead/Ea22-like family protein [Klebsiella pneumoniae]
MTDITELAQRMKAAAVRAKTATEEYASGHMSVSVCFAECEEFNRLTDGPDNIIALVDALEKAQRYIEELREWNAGLAQESFERQQRISELLEGKVGNALLERENHHVELVGKLTAHIAELESRTVKLPKLKMLEDYLAEVAIEERKQILVGVKLEFHRALNAAGIKVEAE